MALIRIPFPDDPEERQRLFDKASLHLARFGSYQGTTEAGVFQGSTPIGHFSGNYRCPQGGGFMEIELTRKPFLVPTSVVEHELRRLMNHLATS